ncbi:Hint domain-containing protein [Gymnodinialimonas sp. 57CJ19]|uniref:Hint domain-containing protein n=1 Tax=Gymnodinialimonas sp. 57CJ19 TaxID=3138498 RepID=UPI003134282E
MPTYIIVSKDKDPLGPNEINAGDKIEVNDGDVFIVDPSADDKIEFKSASGASTDFEVRFEQSNANKLDVTFKDDLNPTINISDDVDLGETFIDADKADSITLYAGDRVTLDHYHGSDGVDIFTAGDDFTMHNHLKTNKGDDVIRIGANASLDEIDGGKGNDTLYSQTDPSEYGAKDIENVQVVCFAAGTMIGTGSGQVPVECLKVGDYVSTLDHGQQPIRWIGSRSLDLEDLTAKPKLRPVRIAAGALGAGTPTRDLIVSPQHRILVRSAIAKRMFDTADVLVPAIKLVGIDGITVIEDATGVTYFHVLLDRHELLLSEGAATESLYLGPQALAGLPPEASEEILYLFPQLADRKYRPEPARLIPDKGQQMKSLAQRHGKNRKALVAELA